MKPAIICILAAFFSTRSFAYVAKPHRRDDLSGLTPEQAAAHASNMAIYSSNNAVVASQESSLIELQKTWNGGVAASTTSSPAIPSAVQADAVVNTSSEALATSSPILGGAVQSAAVKDVVHDGGPGHGSWRGGWPSSTVAPTGAPTPTSSYVPSNTPSPSSVYTPPGTTASPGTSSVAPTGTGGPSSGKCSSGSPCRGAATPEGYPTAGGAGACTAFTLEIGYDLSTMMGVAIPQWYSVPMGFKANNDVACCGDTVTVKPCGGGADIVAHIVDVDGGGGGQRVDTWLDMSDALFDAVTAGGCEKDAQGYNQVTWHIN